MSDNNWDDDDFENEGLSGNDLIRDLRKQLKAAKKETSTLAEKLKGFETQSRESEVKSALKAAGLNEQVAKFVPADADLKVWIDENAELFGGTAPTTETTDASTTTTSTVPADQARALQDISAATTNGGQVPADAYARAENRLKDVKSPEELTQVLAQLQRGQV
jgi:hypothetical protein